MYAMNRVNPMGLQFQLMEISNQITRIKCGNKQITVPYNIHTISQSWYDWTMQAQFIQVAFKYMTPSEREFLMTSITPTEWAAMMESTEEREEE